VRRFDHGVGILDLVKLHPRLDVVLGRECDGLGGELEQRPRGLGHDAVLAEHQRMCADLDRL